jgi:hypothetical protein
MNHGNATSTGHTGRWVVAPVLATLAATALGAQQVPDYESIYIIRGAVRDTTTAALLQAGWVGGPRSLQVYRVAGSIEGVFRNYLRRLGGTPDAAPDTLERPVAGNSPPTYHLVFHTFDDQCMDATPSTPASAGTACHRWRRGKDKRRSLDGSRIAYETGSWIEVATFTWFHREPSGELQRVRVEIRDIGLSPNWQQHTPLAQLLLESVSLPPGAP